MPPKNSRIPISERKQNVVLSILTNNFLKQEKTVAFSPEALAGNAAEIGECPPHLSVTSHRVGDGVTSVALSHHRTCGSAYGGSFNKLEALPGVQQRDQP
jgi:hypothetical protein